MKTLNLKKQYQELYKASAKEPTLLTVPDLNYLMLDGQGDPNGTLFQRSVETLYALAYTLKFMLKKAKIADYPVMPLEGLWWMGNGKEWDSEKRDQWLWTIMIMQPEIITPDYFQQARDLVGKKKNLELLPQTRLAKLPEGLSAQILHRGPFSTEGETIKTLLAFMRAQGYGLRGNHHEIYLSDPRRCAPEKLKTILRHPAETPARRV